MASVGSMGSLCSPSLQSPGTSLQSPSSQTPEDPTRRAIESGRRASHLASCSYHLGASSRQSSGRARQSTASVTRQWDDRSLREAARAAALGGDVDTGLFLPPLMHTERTTSRMERTTSLMGSMSNLLPRAPSFRPTPSVLVAPAAHDADGAHGAGGAGSPVAPSSPVSCPPRRSIGQRLSGRLSLGATPAAGAGGGGQMELGGPAQPARPCSVAVYDSPSPPPAAYMSPSPAAASLEPYSAGRERSGPDVEDDPTMTRSPSIDASGLVHAVV